jgi:hypothetical protein
MQNIHIQQPERDFLLNNHLRNAEMTVEDNYNNIDGIIGNAPEKNNAEQSKTLIDRLEYFKAIAEENANDHKQPCIKQRGCAICL